MVIYIWRIKAELVKQPFVKTEKPLEIKGIGTKKKKRKKSFASGKNKLNGFRKQYISVTKYRTAVINY